MLRNWLRRFSKPVRGSGRRSLRRPLFQNPRLSDRALLRVEVLEDRLAPAITITDAPAFVVTTDAADNVTIDGLGAGGVVRVNGVDQTTAASAVTSLTVTSTGTFDNQYDLSNVLPATFTSLTTIGV